MKHMKACLSLAAVVWMGIAGSLEAQVLDKQKLFEAYPYWDNRDFDWYAQNIPFFECPDADIVTTYYYRWDLLTKHLTYGSPNSGYSFTEFIDRPFWSGAYGSISCPAGHQLYEARWLHDERYARDYARYWFRTPGAQPRRYSTWLADSVWAIHQARDDREFAIDLLADLVKNHEAWKAERFVPEVGLFWQFGHDDGMEYNIASRQTRDLVRGAPCFRPSFNAYMWADAIAIARIADLAGDRAMAGRYRAEADGLKQKLQALLWDPKRNFFFSMFRDDEERDGFRVKAGTLMYQWGQFAGDSHGRELIGYVPWQFGMVDAGKGYETAWAKLVDADGFKALFGPTTVERKDPMFLLQKTCCWWSGQSWPYATTQTLKALARALQEERPGMPLTAADYLETLHTYARSHRKDGKPYIAEALHPDTGSFAGHDAYNHSEHYFHSGYCDLVITGLVGLVPRDDNTIVVHPLAPDSWDWFALDDILYHDRRISIVWDKTGQRYGQGAGLIVLADGQKLVQSPRIERVTAVLPAPAPARPRPKPARVNFAVNNDGAYYPRVTASYSSPETSLAKLNDGNYWYLVHPPNRWTCQGSPNRSDWVMIDLGVERAIDTVKLYVLDDGEDTEGSINLPRRVLVESWREGAWRPFGTPLVAGKDLAGKRASVIRLEQPIKTRKLRVTLEQAGAARSGLTEIEAWGDAVLPVEPAPGPPGNLALNASGRGFPRARASFTDRFGGNPMAAIDGKTVFTPNPMNRWTSYESKAKSDWLEIDFGRPIEFRRVELAIYDDRGGVQAPETYTLEQSSGDGYAPIENVVREPAKPAGGVWNTARFAPVKAARLRIVFTHRGQAQSGVTEVMVSNE